MPIWIPISVTAALLQCWRTAMQQKLRGLLSVNGAGFVRYLYGMPTALVLLVIATEVTGVPLPALNPLFLLWCAFAGRLLPDLFATNLPIMSFGYRNFAKDRHRLFQDRDGAKRHSRAAGAERAYLLCAKRLDRNRRSAWSA